MYRAEESSHSVQLRAGLVFAGISVVMSFGLSPVLWSWLGLHQDLGVRLSVLAALISGVLVFQFLTRKLRMSAPLLFLVWGVGLGTLLSPHVIEQFPTFMVVVSGITAGLVLSLASRPILMKVVAIIGPGLVVSSLAVGFIAGWQIVFKENWRGSLSSWLEFGDGVLVNPILDGGLPIILVISLSVLLFEGKRLQFLWPLNLVLVALCFVGLLMTDSLSAVIMAGYLAAIATTSWIASRVNVRNPGLVSFVTVTIAGAVVIVTYLEYAGFDIRGGNLTGRLPLWIDTLANLRHMDSSSIWATGYQNTLLVQEGFSNFGGFRPRNSHNAYLDAYIGFGLLGAIGLCLCLALIVSNLLVRLRLGEEVGSLPALLGCIVVLAFLGPGLMSAGWQLSLLALVAVWSDVNRDDRVATLHRREHA